jgi:hypothetical protein
LHGAAGQDRSCPVIMGQSISPHVGFCEQSAPVKVISFLGVLE